VRLYAVLLGSPDEAHRDRDVARLLDWGFDRYKRARLVRRGQAFGQAGGVRVIAAKGLAVTLDPGEQVHERIVLPSRLEHRVRAGERVGYVELRSGRGVIGRVALVAGTAGGGPPAFVPWAREKLRSLI
jgi:D-alanyl-D-alanine carboxypeptidase